MSTFDDTAWLLEQWAGGHGRSGEWSGAFHLSSLSRARTPTASVSLLINDLVAGEIDHTVAKLCSYYDPEMGRAVALYYLRGWDYRKLAEKLGVSTRRALTLVKSGVSWVSDALDSE